MGEHSIGLGKIDYLIQEYSSSIALMKQIKKLFDPYFIFNPVETM
jgi:FAD/FMN-containing dehydrogenase